MSNNTISRKVFEVLLKHLVDMEEKRGQLLDRHYPDLTREREMFENLLNDYMKKIEQSINHAKIIENAEKVCPFIIIGSIVELENLDGSGNETYQIVSPFESSLHSDIDSASFLSPVGKELLLKKEMDKVTIENASGQYTYVIKSINISDEMLSFLQKEG